MTGLGHQGITLGSCDEPTLVEKSEDSVGVVLPKGGVGPC